MKHQQIQLFFLIYLFNQINPSYQNTILKSPIAFGQGVYQMYVNIRSLYQDFKLALIDITSPYTHAPFTWNFNFDSQTLKVINPVSIMTIESNITKGIEISETLSLR